MRQAALKMVHELALDHPKVLFIGSDLGAGTLKDLRAERPEQFFMEGVCEANIIGMAAGLAMEGFVPYFNTIATFITRRCLEQVAIDICLHNLPVRLLGSGGGLVYAPLGPTHLAFDDMALLRTMPNMAIVAPSDAEEMRRAIAASLDWPGPLYMRIAKGNDPVISRPDTPFAIGRAIMLRDGSDVGFVSTGIMTGRCLAAADRLAAEHGIEASVLHMHTVKPLDEAALLALANSTGTLVTVEEHSRNGGLGTAVLETIGDSRLPVRVHRLGLPDRFPEGYGSQDHLLTKAGLDATQIAAAAATLLREIRL
ncbi:MAG TPA: transketolase C-terminal domain-containing protein [Aliidongia sp.]|nr:transketolase C-terminal domain-containing protein [Aliidongia sp.]